MAARRHARENRYHKELWFLLARWQTDSGSLVHADACMPAIRLNALKERKQKEEEDRHRVKFKHDLSLDKPRNPKPDSQPSFLQPNWRSVHVDVQGSSQGIWQVGFLRIPLKGYVGTYLLIFFKALANQPISCTLKPRMKTGIPLPPPPPPLNPKRDMLGAELILGPFWVGIYSLLLHVKLSPRS